MTKARMDTSDERGIALIEALVALFIFSMGILAVIGMQAASIKTSADAKYRANATVLADQILGQMWADQGVAQVNLANYVTGAANCALVAPGANANLNAWLNTVASTLPGAEPGRQRIQFNAATKEVMVTICWTTPSSIPGDPPTVHNHVVSARMNNNG